MRVLFCTDGSKISHNAIRNFSNFAGKNTIVDTICVIDWSFLPDDAVIEDSGFAGSCRNVADGILEFSKKLIEENNLTNGEQIKHCGAAVESILEQLNENIYDYIVMGSHGKKGFQRWLGSVSREVLESTNIPIYISKEKHQNQNILFTTDGSEISYQITTECIKKLNLENKNIYICTAAENPDLLFLEGTLDANWLMAIQNQQQIYAEKSIEKIKKLFEEKSLNIKETKVLNGSAAQSIIDYAKEESIDLIVMGSRIKTKLQNFLLDSVSKRVIEHSNSDTLIIKK